MKQLFFGLILWVNFVYGEKIIIIDNTMIALPVSQSDMMLSPVGKHIIDQLTKKIKLIWVPWAINKSAQLGKNPFIFLDPLTKKSDPAKQKHASPMYKGKSIHPIMKPWITNQVTSKDALTLISDGLNNSQLDATTKQFYHNCAKLVFDPKAALSTFKPNETIIDLLRNLKKRNNKLVLATNWNAQILEALMKDTRFVNIYSLFDEIKLSEPKSFKPQKMMYEGIRKLFEDDITSKSEQPIYINIETEESYIKTAESCGMKSIIYTGAEALKTHLQKLGALPKADNKS